MLTSFNEIIVSITGVDLSEMPCGGAAGGISVSLKSFFDAELVNGIDYLLEIMEFDGAIRNANLLVTAEGHADSQTLAGKGPSGVARKAAEYDVPTILLAGRVDDVEELNSVFNSVFPITNGVNTLENVLRTTSNDLEQTCHQLGNLLAMEKME
jgi:glycerate kinase